MSKEKIVVALGGNALGKTPEEQKKLVKHTAKTIVDLIENGKDVILSHGNGPQVGMINLAFEDMEGVDMPFAECVAMSQGYIGYHLQNAIREELLNRKIDKNIATIVSQFVVDKNDEAFDSPTKPIGSFYSKEEAEKIARERKYIMKEDAGRGYRRVVPSPRPIDIAELELIKTLIDNGACLIAAGGGGIPVVKEGNSLKGVDAVIDKDFASGLMAQLVDADSLIILTAVDKVSINYGKENEKWLDEMTVDECQQYIEEGHFAKGSMLPKIQAALEFCKSKKGRVTRIASLNNPMGGTKIQ